MPSKNQAAIEMSLGAEFTSELVPGETKTPDLCVHPRILLDLRRDEARAIALPLLTVEIVSPSRVMQEIMDDKVDFYLAHGVQSAWVVTPPLREVTIFLPDGSQQSHHGGTVRDPATGTIVDLEAVLA